MDELSFNQAIRVLCDHGLVEADRSSEASEIESKGYSIHSCVHSWTIHVLNQEWDSETAGLVLECVGFQVPLESTHKPWVTRRRLIRHAVRCGGFVLNGTAKNKDREWALHEIGSMFSKLGRLDEAEKMYQRALQGREKTFDPDHTSIFNTINNLGNLYTNLKKFDEAKMMYQRALQGYEKAMGPEAMRTYTPALNTSRNLAKLYARLGEGNI